MQGVTSGRLYFVTYLLSSIFLDLVQIYATNDLQQEELFENPIITHDAAALKDLKLEETPPLINISKKQDIKNIEDESEIQKSSVYLPAGINTKIKQSYKREDFLKMIPKFPSPPQAQLPMFPLKPVERNAGNIKSSSSISEAMIDKSGLPEEDEMELQPVSETEEEQEEEGEDELKYALNANAIRIIESDLIYPNLIPAYQNSIVCGKEGEMYYLRIGQCFICTCVREAYNLLPKCAKCNQCMLSPAIPDTPPPFIPDVIPTIVPDVVPTEPSVTCSPFPTLEPFENPINPCQICVCQPTISPKGIPDVMISCENSQECIIPTPAAPIIIPTNNPFPDFTTMIPPPEPINEIIPSIPPIPVIPPIPPPPITEVPPVPWPPVNPSPSPLPGPSPHDTCSPYPPNTYFQHPWDTCQYCLCTEYKTPQRSEIEVTCRTKPECCIIAPSDSDWLSPICKDRIIGQSFTLPGSPCQEFTCKVEYNEVYVEVTVSTHCSQEQLIIPDPICRQRPIAAEFSHPSDTCMICHCEIYGSIVAPICKKTNKCGSHLLTSSVEVEAIVYMVPICRFTPPYKEFYSGCSVCQCMPVYSYVIANCRPQPTCDRLRSDVATKTEIQTKPVILDIVQDRDEPIETILSNKNEIEDVVAPAVTLPADIDVASSTPTQTFENPEDNRYDYLENILKYNGNQQYLTPNVPMISNQYPKATFMNENQFQPLLNQYPSNNYHKYNVPYPTNYLPDPLQAQSHYQGQNLGQPHSLTHPYGTMNWNSPNMPHPIYPFTSHYNLPDTMFQPQGIPIANMDIIGNKKLFGSGMMPFGQTYKQPPLNLPKNLLKLKTKSGRPEDIKDEDNIR